MKNTTKKILIVTTSNKIAGAEKSIVDLIHFSDKSLFIFKLVVIKNEKNGKLKETVASFGCEVESLDINSKWEFFKLIKLYKIIKNFKPDILQSFLYFDNQMCRILGKIIGAKYIVSGQQNAEEKIPLFRELIDKMTFNFANFIISNSDAGKEFFSRRKYKINNKIYVIKNGIDLKYLKDIQIKNTGSDFNLPISFPNKDAYKIVAVGYLTEQKGIIYLIKALEILKNKGVIFECFIIGQGVLMESIKNEIYSRGLKNEVHLLGYISEAYKYFNLFDLFTLPSLWEGLPNVVMEAMGSRLPVLATSVGGVPEIIKDRETGFIVEPGNFQLLADKIEYAISLNKEDVNRITESAYTLMENNFNIDVFIKNYKEFYDQCN